MRVDSCITPNPDISQISELVSKGLPYDYTLQGPNPKNRDFVKCITQEYLKGINSEKNYNLLCLCLEEIISNSVKANIKRAYFISNNLDISNHEDYEKGMKNFKEQGVSNVRDPEFVKRLDKMGLYVRIHYQFIDDCLIITARNNSVISNEELERINKKLKLSENKSPEDIFMNSIDQTEGAGLGIIMITKIMNQISSIKQNFSIRATDTETITELKIRP